MRTKAVRLYGEMDLRLEEFDLPPMGEGDILIKIVTDSVCMSTWKIAVQGAKHYRVPNDIAEHPTIVGHEFCGEVAEVGAKWKGRYQPGDKIIIPPVLYYLGGVDAIGYSFPDIGGDSTYALVHEHVIDHGYLIKVNSPAFFSASLVEPVSCILRGYKATFHLDGEEGNHVTGLKEGGKLAILAGCGPMGMEAIDLALHGDRKPALVVVTDLDQERLDRAAHIFDPAEAERNGTKLVFANTADADTLRDLSGGTGFDDVFVMIAAVPVVELADAILAFDGCLNFFCGPTDKSFAAKFNFYNVHYNQHHVSGTSGSTVGDMRDIVRLIGEGRINPAVMITHIGGLNAAIDATLNLPKLPGGKKLIYTHLELPLTVIADFGELGRTDARFAELDRIVREHRGLWCAEAEAYLLSHF
ncbi:MAG: zinc-binding dehydrogenase [Oscillibacter sp.]|nr:zinc-binding dehydrogenase [Oscillibacter sp.]